LIYALLLGRDKSKGFPNKNIIEVLGMPIMVYPILAAQKSKLVDHIFVSTDSGKIQKIGKKYGVTHIKRPPELCTDEALGEDAFRHGYEWIKENYNSTIDFMVLMFCNAVCVTHQIIDQGIKILIDNPEFDSAVTVSRYNMWSPLRSRKINKEGLLDPFVPFKIFGNPNTLNCDRDSQGDVWYADMGVSIVRSRCIENLENGLLPQKWMGNKIYPLEQEAGFDLDYEWQLPTVEYWLKRYGGY